MAWAIKPTIYLSGEDVARFAYTVGVRDPNNLITAVAIAQAESGFGQNGKSSTSDYGLWQINGPAHPSYDTARLMSDPLYNAQAMFAISGQGKNFTPWAAYSPDFSQAKAGTGPYKAHLNAARDTVNKVMGTTVQLPTNPVSNPTNPADVTAQAPAPAYSYNAPIVHIDPSERQLQFDSRHRRVGTRSRLMDIFAGPTYTGVMYPVLPDNSQGKTPSYGSQRGVRGEGGGGSGPQGMGVGVSGGALAVFFEFNPNEISFDYSANPNVLPIGALDPSQTNTNLPMPDSNTIISFDLFFDRTYEVMDGGKNTIGVLSDIRALEHLCGISDAEPVMRQNPVAIHLGAPVQFHFKALIKGFGVKYQHFSHAMVPMRAVVSISATRLSNTDPWATEETVTTFTGEDWRDKVIDKNKDGGSAWDAAAGGGSGAPASSASSNNPWVAVAGGGS
jgi:hypothetical protein